MSSAAAWMDLEIVTLSEVKSDNIVYIKIFWYDFSSSQVQMWDLDHKEDWALKNWCFWIVGLEKTLENLLDFKEIKPVNPKENKPWIFIERTDPEAESSVLWPPEAKSWLIWKDPDAGKDWWQD